MKKLLILSLFLIIANNIFGQQNYWDKAETKYQSDYREKIRDNMYSKPGVAPSINYGTNNTSLEDLFPSKEKKAEWAAQEKANDIKKEANRNGFNKAEVIGINTIKEIDGKMFDYNKFVPEITNYVSAATAFYDGKKTGYQTFTNADIEINANLRNGIIEGLGTITLKNHPKITSINALFFKGKFNGKATILFKNGEAENVNFVNNNLYGKCFFLDVSGKIIIESNRNNNSISGLVKRFYEGYSFANILYKDNKPVTLFKADLRDQQFYYPSYEMYHDGGYVYDGNLEKTISSADGAFYGGFYKGGQLNEINKGDRLKAWDNGILYVGPFKKGERTGLGKYFYENGNIYIGNFKDGEMRGFGKYYYVSGAVYEGNFQENERHGQGKLTWEDGIIYEGEFKNGERHGDGKLTKIDGKYMLGTFKENNPKKVKYYDAQNQEITLEQYNIAVQNGFARGDYSNKSFFEGNFENGKRYGKGFMLFENGANYDGEWLSDKMHGKGTLKLTDGYLYEGDFANDQKVGYGEEKFANGDTYHGNFLNNERHGIGIYTWANKNKIEGEFIDGNAQGQGTFTWANGEYYKGEFSKFLFNGFGKIYDANGLLTFNGSHYNGQRVGNATVFFKDSNETAIGYYMQGFWNGEVKFSKPSGFYKTAFGMNNTWSKLVHYNPAGETITEEEYNKN